MYWNHSTVKSPVPNAQSVLAGKVMYPVVPFSKYELQSTVNGDTGLEPLVNAGVVTPPEIVGVAVEVVGPINESNDSIVMPAPTEIPGPTTIAIIRLLCLLQGTHDHHPK
jgi:hypothetical protein